MGRRSRERRARRAWLLSAAMPYVQRLAERVRKAPEREAYRLGLRLGAVFAQVGFTRATIAHNLAVACGRELDRPERREFERRYYRHLALLLVDFLRQPRITRENLARYVGGPALTDVPRVHAEGRGTILVAGHAGLWEMAGHAGALLGLPLTSVAKMSDHPGLDAFVASLREAGGQRVRDVRGSMWAMKKALDRGEAIGINVDQEARLQQVFAPFFGVRAATSAAPAELHLRTGAPILVVTVHRVGPFRYEARCFEEIRHERSGDHAADVLAVTTRINAGMEAALRLHPEQWLWSHRRWRRRPPDEAPGEFRRLPGSEPLAP